MGAKVIYPGSCIFCEFWSEGDHTCSRMVHPAECEFVEEAEDGFGEIVDADGEAVPVSVCESHNGIRLIVDSYFQLQKIRIAVGNRVNAVANKTDEPGESYPFLRSWHGKLVEMEKDCVKYVGTYLKEHPTWPWLKCVKGIGPVLAARLLSMIDIEKADTISALWRYAGLAVVDGKAEKPTKGEKLHYNKRLKTSMYLVAMSFIKSKSKFAEIYYREKERQQQLHPELKPIVIHYRALRKMEKVFLGCLWLVWREAVGLPTRNPYGIDYLGHTTLYEPWEFAEKGKKVAKKVKH